MKEPDYSTTFSTDSATDLVSRQTLSDQVYERLKQDIITHKIGFGEKLANRELQKRFGVSSTPVRDAINHLYVDGLLDTITNGGARVITLDLKVALEINYLVLLFTKGAVRLMAKEGLIPRLAELLAPLVEDQAHIQSQEEYILLDQAFHQTFFDLCGNGHLQQLYTQYILLFELLVRMTCTDFTHHSARLIEHQQIYECCRSCDVEELCRKIEHHYDSAATWFTDHAAALGSSQSAEN